MHKSRGTCGSCGKSTTVYENNTGDDLCRACVIASTKGKNTDYTPEERAEYLTETLGEKFNGLAGNSMKSIRHGVYVTFDGQEPTELYAIEAPAQATDRQILKIARGSLQLAKTMGIIGAFKVRVAPVGLGGVTQSALNAAASLLDVG